MSSTAACCSFNRKTAPSSLYKDLNSSSDLLDCSTVTKAWHTGGVAKELMLAVLGRIAGDAETDGNSDEYEDEDVDGADGADGAGNSAALRFRLSNKPCHLLAISPA